MITVNAIGDACPVPVVKTRKAMETIKGAEVVETLVDNEIAVENLKKMAGQMGYQVKDQKLEEGQYSVQIMVTEAEKTENIQADILLLLTAVDAVSVNFGKKNQKQLGRVTGSELERYVKEGQFPAGSMLPKVQAALKFVRHNPKGKVIISSLERAREAVEEGCGTIISADEEMLSGVS